MVRTHTGNTRLLLWLYDVFGPIHLFGVNGLLLLASAAWVMLLLRNPKASW